MATYASAATIAANPGAGYTLDTGIKSAPASAPASPVSSGGGGGGVTIAAAPVAPKTQAQTDAELGIIRDAGGNIIHEAASIINPTARSADIASQKLGMSSSDRVELERLMNLQSVNPSARELQSPSVQSLLQQASIIAPISKPTQFQNVWTYDAQGNALGVKSMSANTIADAAALVAIGGLAPIGGGVYIRPTQGYVSTTGGESKYMPGQLDIALKNYSFAPTVHLSEQRAAQLEKLFGEENLIKAGYMKEGQHLNDVLLTPAMERSLVESERQGYISQKKAYDAASERYQAGAPKLQEMLSQYQANPTPNLKADIISYATSIGGIVDFGVGKNYSPVLTPVAKSMSLSQPAPTTPGGVSLSGKTGGGYLFMPGAAPAKQADTSQDIIAKLGGMLEFGNLHAASVPQIVSGSPEQAFLYSSGMPYGAGTAPTAAQNEVLAKLGNLGGATYTVGQAKPFQLTVAPIGTYQVAASAQKALPELSQAELNKMSAPEIQRYYSDRGMSTNIVGSSTPEGERFTVIPTGISNQAAFIENNPTAKKTYDSLVAKGGTNIQILTTPTKDGGFTYTMKAYGSKMDYAPGSFESNVEKAVYDAGGFIETSEPFKTLRGIGGVFTTPFTSASDASKSLETLTGFKPAEQPEIIKKLQASPEPLATSVATSFPLAVSGLTYQIIATTPEFIVKAIPGVTGLAAIGAKTGYDVLTGKPISEATAARIENVQTAAGETVAQFNPASPSFNPTLAGATILSAAVIPSIARGLGGGLRSTAGRLYGTATDVTIDQSQLARLSVSAGKPVEGYVAMKPVVVGEEAVKLVPVAQETGATATAAGTGVTTSTGAITTTKFISLAGSKFPISVKTTPLEIPVSKTQYSLKAFQATEPIVTESVGAKAVGVAEVTPSKTAGVFEARTRTYGQVPASLAPGKFINLPASAEPVPVRPAVSPMSGEVAGTQTGTGVSYAAGVQTISEVKPLKMAVGISEGGVTTPTSINVGYFTGKGSAAGRVSPSYLSPLGEDVSVVKSNLDALTRDVTSGKVSISSAQYTEQAAQTVGGKSRMLMSFEGEPVVTTKTIGPSTVKVTVKPVGELELVSKQPFGTQKALPSYKDLYPQTPRVLNIDITEAGASAKIVEAPTTKTPLKFTDTATRISTTEPASAPTVRSPTIAATVQEEAGAVKTAGVSAESLVKTQSQLAAEETAATVLDTLAVEPTKGAAIPSPPIALVSPVVQTAKTYTGEARPVTVSTAIPSLKYQVSTPKAVGVSAERVASALGTQYARVVVPGPANIVRSIESARTAEVNRQIDAAKAVSLEATRLGVAQVQAVPQMQITGTAVTPIPIVSLPVGEIPPPPPGVPPTLLPQPPTLRDLSGFPYYRAKRRYTQYTPVGVGGQYADLLSIMQSQSRYGKATSPSFTKRPYLWQTSMIRTPTVEMIEASKQAKPQYKPNRQPPKAISIKKIQPPQRQKVIGSRFRVGRVM